LKGREPTVLDTADRSRQRGCDTGWPCISHFSQRAWRKWPQVWRFRRWWFFAVFARVVLLDLRSN